MLAPSFQLLPLEYPKDWLTRYQGAALEEETPGVLLCSHDLGVSLSLLNAPLFIGDGSAADTTLHPHDEALLPVDNSVLLPGSSVNGSRMKKLQDKRGTVFWLRSSPILSKDSWSNTPLLASSLIIKTRKEDEIARKNMMASLESKTSELRILKTFEQAEQLVPKHPTDSSRKVVSVQELFPSALASHKQTANGVQCSIVTFVSPGPLKDLLGVDPSSLRSSSSSSSFSSASSAVKQEPKSAEDIAAAALKLQDNVLIKHGENKYGLYIASGEDGKFQWLSEYQKLPVTIAARSANNYFITGLNVPGNTHVREIVEYCSYEERLKLTKRTRVCIFCCLLYLCCGFLQCRLCVLCGFALTCFPCFGWFSFSLCLDATRSLQYIPQSKECGFGSG